MCTVQKRWAVMSRGARCSFEQGSRTCKQHKSLDVFVKGKYAKFPKWYTDSDQNKRVVLYLPAERWRLQPPWGLGTGWWYHRSPGHSGGSWYHLWSEPGRSLWRAGPAETEGSGSNVSTQRSVFCSSHRGKNPHQMLAGSSVHHFDLKYLDKYLTDCPEI